MRHEMKRILLLSILLTATLTRLCAQDTEDPQAGVDPAMLLTDGMPGLQEIMNSVELTSGDESLSTENGSPPSPGNIPVDGGISLLLAAGAAYGVRRVRGSHARR
jgi:hypothetical protein